MQFSQSPFVAAIVFIVMRRRPEGRAGLARTRAGTADGLPRRGVAHGDSLAAAVHDHAQATDPGEVVVAEQRLRAQARSVAAGLQGTPGSGHVEPIGGNGGSVSGYGDVGSSSTYTDPHADGAVDPQTGERADGYGDPANDPRLNDSRYDGRLAADYVDPNEDPDQRR